MFRKQDLAALFLIFIAFFCLLLPLRNGFTDDAFIHIQYARNIIDRGEYSFNPGEISFGTTSPLWVMIQSFFGFVLGGSQSLILFSRFLSWLSGFGALAFLLILARSLSGNTLVAVLSTAVFACDAWFLRWTAMSMETSSAAFVMILAGIASIRAYENLRSALFLGFFLAITSLLRPEAFLFFPVYLLSLFVRKGRVDSRCAAGTIVVYALLVIPWLLFAKVHMGSWLPNTAGAKSGGVILNPVIFIRKFSPIAKIIGSTQGIWVVFICISMIFRRGKSSLWDERCRFLLFCAAALPIAYVILDMQVLSRYLLLIMPLVPVFGLISAKDLFARLGITRNKSAAALTVSAVLMSCISIVFYFTIVVPPSRAFARGLTHELRDLALYLKKNSEKNSVVAAADIGYLSFYSNRRVLDLGGLVEPSTGRLRSRFSYEKIIADGMYLNLSGYPHVDYFIDREKQPNRFEGAAIGGYAFESILVKVIDNLGIRKPGPYYYTLYKLRTLNKP